MKIFITGGCKNGKSFFAQELIYKLADGGKKYYIATMNPTDDEDRTRIKRHIAEREGYDYVTIEQPFNIASAVDFIDKDGSILLDSTTALLMNEMFLSDGTVVQDAHKKIIEGVLSLLNHAKHIAVVSDWIYSDAMIFDELTEEYRRNLATIDKMIAQEADTVCEVTFGNVVFHKGGL